MAFGFALVASGPRSGALAIVEMLLERGRGVSVDLFGERVSDSAIADAVLADYLGRVAVLPPSPADVWLSMDLSHLAGGAGAAGAADRLAAIAEALPSARVQVGAEEAALSPMSSTRLSSRWHERDSRTAWRHRAGRCLNRVAAGAA